MILPITLRSEESPAIRSHDNAGGGPTRRQPSRPRLNRVSTRRCCTFIQQVSHCLGALTLTARYNHAVQTLSRIVNGRAVATNAHRVMVMWTCASIPTNMANYGPNHFVAMYHHNRVSQPCFEHYH